MMPVLSLFEPNFEISDDLFKQKSLYGRYSFPVLIANSQSFRCVIYAINKDYQKLISPSSILYIHIEDDMLSWGGLKGYLIIDDKLNAFERGFSTKYGANMETGEPFIFRNDGRDYLRIEIYPVGFTDNEKSPQPITIPDEWKINKSFSITNVEELESKNNIEKQLKISFEYAPYSLLKQLILNWSTATLLNPNVFDKIIQNLTDKERSLKVGDAIQKLIQFSYQYFNTIDNTFPEDIYQSIIDADNWDLCSNDIFYTSKLENTVADDIEYLRKLCVSNDDIKDICFLLNDRTTEKWQLIPLYKLINTTENKKRQIAHMWITTLSDLSNSPSPRLAPIYSTVNELNIDVPYKVDRFIFKDMQVDVNKEKINNRPVFMYDYKNKRFYNYYKDNYIKKSKDFVTDTYLPILSQNMNGIMNKCDTINMDLNKMLLGYNSINPIYSEYNQTLNTIQNIYGRNDVLMNLLLNNQHITLDVEGATFFRSGKIIAFESPTQMENKYDYKLYGQWLITNVKTIFNRNMFRTEVGAVKIHASGKIDNSQDIL